MPVDEFGREVPGGRHDGGRDYYDPPPPPRGHHHRQRPPSSSPPPSHHHMSQERREINLHPSLNYAKEPLLCEYLWVEKNKPKEEDDDDSKTTYEAYRRSYCLNYIRAFFNKHLDDTWFRSRYSPMGQQRFAVLERNRSVQEAQALWQQMVQDEVSFLAGARLGGGIKSSSSSVSSPPVSHLFSWQQPQSATTALLVSDIPSVVTDEQLLIAILNHCSLVEPKQPDLVVYAGAFIPTTGSLVLQRQAVVVGQAPVIQDIWTNLCKHARSKDHSIPRKEDEHDEVMSLDVDCTDPYGRLEYDEDGRGGAPPNRLTVPVKKSTVGVQRLRTTSSTTVLTAALSSTTRCASDQVNALRLAQSLDRKRPIPTDCGIDALLGKLFGEDPKDSVQDVLDVCIAYLRRVHLVSFYNGCDQPAKAVADTLTGRHPSSTIHLRLQDADATLKRAADDEVKDSKNGGEVVKDLLVLRLDDSISRAMEDCEKVDELIAATAGDEQLLSVQLGLAPEVIQDAKEIQAAEDRVCNKWLHDHSLMDDDHRARCSFHFCHKLFKDTSFLHKHLLKKHVEYLSAEQAKVHDEYMMKAWEAASDRPVPDVLVDCGSRCGYVAASVTGQVPDCDDPEPGLWKREEERQEKEKQEREMMMRSRRDDVRHHQQHHHHPHSFTPKEAEPVRRSQFVDVDDMKVEKVEMSFENVEVPVVVAQKKKKKRKLL